MDRLSFLKALGVGAVLGPWLKAKETVVVKAKSIPTTEPLRDGEVVALGEVEKGEVLTEERLAEILERRWAKVPKEKFRYPVHMNVSTAETHCLGDWSFCPGPQFSQKKS